MWWQVDSAPRATWQAAHPPDLLQKAEWEALPISSANYMDVIPVGFERQDGDMYSKPGVGDRIIVNFSDTGWSCGLVESSLVAKVTRGGTNGQMCLSRPLWWPIKGL